MIMSGLQNYLKEAAGYILTMLAHVLNSWSAMAAQALQGYVPPFQLMNINYMYQTVASIIMLLVRKESILISKEYIPSLLAAGVLNDIVNTAFYTSAVMLPLGTMMSSIIISSTLSGVLIQKFIYKKEFGLLKMVILSLAVVGILLLMQPEIIFGSMSVENLNISKHSLEIWNITTTESYSFVEKRYGNLPPETFGIILTVIGGVCSAVRSVVFRTKLPSVPYLALGFWLGILGILPYIIISIYTEKMVFLFSMAQFWFAMAHGLTGGICSIIYFYAQQTIDVIPFSMLQSIELVVDFIAQHTIMRGILPGRENLLELFGTVLIVFSSFASVFIYMKEDRNENINKS